MKKLRLLIIFLSAVLLLCCSVIPGLSKEAFAFTLPDTGQTKCYDTAGTEMACAGTGQDGEYNINPMSYTDNGNGTITDNVTGLIWQKAVNPTVYNWHQASGTYDATYNPSSQSVCGSLTLGGYSSWRLPTKKELMSIVDYSISPGARINTTYFQTSASTYWYWWSSTSVYSGTRIPCNAWYVSFNSGSVQYDSMFYGGNVRCVRGGQSSPSFTNNGNGTVTDNGTGLMWQQGEPGRKTWADALTYCEGLSLGGQSDWRLPNIKELASIIDETQEYPAIDTTYFSNTTAEGYWSSTSYTINEFVWLVRFDLGVVDTSFRPYFEKVRCVRGVGAGQSGVLCDLAISPSSQSLTSSGGTGSVTVTASDSSCDWTASSSLNWVTITSGSSGTGNGVVAISVAANTTGAARTGNITIADKTFMVTQSADTIPCNYTIKPVSKTFTSIKGNVVVDVSATGDNCTLNPTESYDWITAALSGKFIQNKTTKKWNGKVKVAVTENNSSTARTGTVDIGGKTFTVTQGGKPCTLTITPAAAKTPMAGAGGTGSFTVKAPDGCNWSAVSANTAWLTLTSGDSGSGNGTVNYTGAENTTGKQRTGKINVATSDKKSKKIFTVVQKKK